MSKSEKKRGVAEEQTATLKEVEDAFAKLSDLELTKLKKFAAYRVRGLGRKAQGRSGDDLLQEVFAAVFAGAQPDQDVGDGEVDPAPVRRWPMKSVNFFGLMHRAIESISGHWSKKLGVDVRLESEFIKTTSDGAVRNTLKTKLSQEPNAEDSMTRDSPIVELEKFFEKDLNASLILEGTKYGKSLPEMINEFGLDAKEAKAADRKLRRKINEMISKGRLDG